MLVVHADTWFGAGSNAGLAAADMPLSVPPRPRVDSQAASEHKHTPPYPCRSSPSLTATSPPLLQVAASCRCSGHSNPTGCRWTSTQQWWSGSQVGAGMMRLRETGSVVGCRDLLCTHHHSGPCSAHGYVLPPSVCMCPVCLCVRCCSACSSCRGGLRP